MAPYVYLDWAATTPLCSEAAAAMAPYLVTGPENIQVNANANSLHTPGRKAFTAMEDARMAFARLIGAKRPDEIIFTSGATEADNLAVMGLVHAAVEAQRAKGNADFVPHVVTTAIEHDAILNPCKELQHEGCQVTYLRPDSNGFISLDSFREALQPNTVLASVMYVNNEVGSVQDVAALCKEAHAHGVLFHTDAVQGLGKCPVNVAKLGVDAASFSAHKVQGPKGVGALYLKARTPLRPQQLGGGQERGLRSGTQNVMGIAGFVAAAQVAVQAQLAETQRLGALRDRLYATLCALPGVKPSVQVEPGSTNFAGHVVNVTVQGIESETLILQLDLAGFGVSGGSACSSQSLSPSHVLSALGMSSDRALCSLRVSMGHDTTEQDIDAFIQAFSAVVKG